MSGALDSLSDVPGVVGAFFVDESDAIAASSMPAYFDGADIEDLAPRLRAVLFASSEIGLRGNVEHCVLRYRDYHLHIRREQPGKLCILTEPHANVPALRMACRLVARRLGRAPVSSGSPASPPPSSRNFTPHPSTAHSPFPPRVSAPPSPPRPTPPTPTQHTQTQLTHTQQTHTQQTPLPLEPAPVSVTPATLPSSHRTAAPEARGMPQAPTSAGAPKIIVYRGRRYQV